MTQVTEEPGTGESDSAAQPVEVLLPEVRQRTRRRRLRNMAIVLLVIAIGAITYGIVGRGSTSPSTTSVGATGDGVGALPSAVRSAPVAMSTQTLLDGRGSVTTYYSGTGTMMVQTHTSSSGVIQSIQRVVYGVAGDRLKTTYTTVFPTESSWASSFSAGGCSARCFADAYLYASPSLVRRLLREHQAVLSKRVTQINGRSVVELLQVQSAGSVAAGSGSLTWIDPTNYEVVRYLAYTNPRLPDSGSPAAPVLNFSWLSNTTSNLSHLVLSIPSGYSQASSRYAGGLLPTPPPIFSSYQAALLTCANQTAAVSNLPTGTRFVAVRSGSVDGTSWTLWFASADPHIAYALMSGSGAGATCVSNSGDTGSAPMVAPTYNVQVVQLPGRPAAFVLGYTMDLAITLVQASMPNRPSVNAVLSRLPSSVSTAPAKLIFAEVSDLSCPAIKQFGFWTDYTISAGATSIGGMNSSPDYSATCVP